MANTLLQLTDVDFENHLEHSTTPLLVDFWASWCAPCRAVGPVLENLSEDFRGRITIAQVNVDTNPAAAARYGIWAIPTLILFDKGEVRGRLVGAHPRAAIQTLLERHAA